METYQIVLLTLAAVLVVKVLGLLVVGRGSLSRFGIALQAYCKIMGDPVLADKARALFNPPPPEPAKPPKLSGEPLRLLALLQREGRLLDFLLEDVAGATRRADRRRGPRHPPQVASR